MAGDLPYLVVKWNGAEITNQVRSARVEDDDRLIDKATIVLADPHHATPDFHPDQTLEVSMGWSEQKAKIFSGVVQNAQGSNAADGTATMTIVAYDKSCLMHREYRDAFYQGTLSSVVRQILSQYTWATPSITCDPDPQFTDHPQLQRTHMTDLQFLQWLAWRYGHRAFCEATGDTNTFYFTSNRRLLADDPMGILQWCRGLRQLKEFRYERVASRAARQQITATPDPHSGTDTPTRGDQPLPISPPLPNPDIVANTGRRDPGELAQQQAGDALAQTNPAPPATPVPVVRLPSDPQLATAVTALDPTQVLGLRGTGRAVGTILLRAKGKVTIQGLAPWAEGDWYVRQAVHTWQDTSTPGHQNATYETSFTVTR
jgi:hypothetical protein